MRAVVVRAFGSIDGLAVGELPEPVAGPGQVLVDVRATAANFVDLLVIGGKYQFRRRYRLRRENCRLGSWLRVVTASRRCGRVTACSRSRSRGYAERVAVAAGMCIPLPDAISFVDAAAMSLAYDTAWFALKERARFAAGESVLVLGASGAVGLAAMQLAKAFGGRVRGAIANPIHAVLVRDNGADVVIDGSVPNLRDQLRADVGAATDGKGADIVLDMLGTPYFEAALRALAWRGRLVVIGFAAGEIPSLRANYLLLKNIEVSGLQVTDYRKRMPELMRACFNEIFALHAAGTLKAAPPQHRAVRARRRFRRALADLQDRAVRDRIILTPNGTA